MNKPSPKLREWLRANTEQAYTTAFDQYLSYVRRQCEQMKGAAVRRGDTEYEKGQAAALDWVLRLHKTLINSADDTTDTSA